MCHSIQHVTTDINGLCNTVLIKLQNIAKLIKSIYQTFSENKPSQVTSLFQ